MPYLAHEMGQYCVFPNFNEIQKYTGDYQPRNFEMFRQDLQDHHMGDQAADFLLASGKLQALCYKAEIEKALRTPGFAGFQLLGLTDFPGQGTALVGVLDAFWDEKGYNTAAEFRRFCNATVPLVRLPKFVFRSDETLEASLELAHFGPQPLSQARLHWQLTDPAGAVLGQGTFGPQLVPIGNGTTLGTVRVPLAGIRRATQLKLTATVEGTPFANDWDVWVYPATLPPPPKDVYFSTALDSKTEEVLRRGGNVYLQLAGKIVKGKEVVQYFQPAFWNTSWFKMRPPHTTGILCQPRHPAFADFPTELHSDLQWWEILDRQQVMVLEDFPPAFRPLVQPIDTWFLNRRLGLLLEAKVGNGKLVVCSADLTTDPEQRPAARQLLYSVQRYMASDQFNPPYSVELAVIRKLLTEPTREQFNAFSKAVPDELRPKAVN